MVPENYDHTPHRRDWEFLGVGGSQRPKTFFMKLLLRGGWVGLAILGKIPSVGMHTKHAPRSMDHPPVHGTPLIFKRKLYLSM